MKRTIPLFLGLLLSTLFLTCTPKKAKTVEVTGIIQEQGITFYQYGTHTVGEYALISKRVDLNAYVGRKVTVIGEKIAGYPVDGGPKYLEVTAVKVVDENLDQT